MKEKVNSIVKLGTSRVLDTEEMTKNALILPLLQSLGYNVFDPNEIVPEYIADIGSKKGEKVDYAIMHNNEPFIFIECKKHGEQLDIHKTQLERYFNTTKSCKFGIITNGISYQFYSDLNNPNILDEKPFYSLNLLNFNDKDIKFLEKFKKETLNIDELLNNAILESISAVITSYMKEQLKSPSDEELINLLISKIHSGKKTQRILDEYTPIIKNSLKLLVNELISDRLSKAQEIDEVNENDGSIVTTEKELEGFRIIQSILVEFDDLENINHKDKKGFFGIHYKDKIQNYIAKLNFNNEAKLSITLKVTEKDFKDFPLDKVKDLYKLKNEIVKSYQLSLSVGK